MRFITEFELTESESNYKDANIRSRRKDRLKQEMGQMISDSFGWENPVNGNTLHHCLEIEAFPMDKWIEFKRRLFSHLGATGLYDPVFKDLISELESFVR